METLTFQTLGNQHLGSSEENQQNSRILNTLLMDDDEDDRGNLLLQSFVLSRKSLNEVAQTELPSSSLLFSKPTRVREANTFT